MGSSHDKLKIPNAFIVNGVQSKENVGSRARGELENVFANGENSIPLSDIVDTNHLLAMVRERAVDACLVPYEDTIATTTKRASNECPWLFQLKQSDDGIILDVLGAFTPSSSLTKVVSKLFDTLKASLDSSGSKLSEGVCLHHRNGPDWKHHCSIWKGNNCLERDDRSITGLVSNRIPASYPKKWVYYIGDEDPTDSLNSEFETIGLQLYHRKKHQLLDYDLLRFASIDHDTMPSVEQHRDLFAAIDFFACSNISSFIGNSVSTFSAYQIVLRRGKNASWYNSRSIPLMADFLKVHRVPLVYTYTELSQSNGKSLLVGSILSARRVFGLTVEIHLLYHESFNDVDFLSWLNGVNVIVHKHEPRWLDAIEKLRVHGDAKRSHLYSHRGNYIGTWQRIDIPLFIDAEYAVLLDADTVIHEQFTIADFGHDITQGIAFSSETNELEKVPLNAGVALLNVPRLRETYTDFVQFIKTHADNNANFIMGPSDQGAYLDFYAGLQEHDEPSTFYKNIKRRGSQVNYLDATFNFKPYYTSMKTFRNRKVTHFHGLKPHDLVGVLNGRPERDFPPALRFLVRKIRDNKRASLVCNSLRDFSLVMVEDLNNLESYCKYSTPLEQVPGCVKEYKMLSNMTDETCLKHQLVDGE
eukprot:g8673.t1 g8673   contig30:11016-12944(-)